LARLGELDRGGGRGGGGWIDHAGSQSGAGGKSTGGWRLFLTGRGMVGCLFWGGGGVFKAGLTGAQWGKTLQRETLKADTAVLYTEVYMSATLTAFPPAGPGNPLPSQLSAIAPCTAVRRSDAPGPLCLAQCQAVDLPLLVSTANVRSSCQGVV